MQEFLINAQRICSSGSNAEERSVPELLADQQTEIFVFHHLGLSHAFKIIFLYHMIDF